jgi:NAD-dependent DNA ligase
MKIIYRNASNLVSLRDINVLHEDELYIDAFCSTSNEYKTFRKDRILEHIEDSSQEEATRKVAKYQELFEIEIKKSGTKWKNVNDRSEICFTGFKSSDKSELVKLAESNGLFVRTGVSSGLSFLVCGSNAGPEKVKVARSKGVILLNKETFMHLLETGEILVE